MYAFKKKTLKVIHVRLTLSYNNGWWLSCPVPWFIKTVNSVYPEFIVIYLFAFIYICQQIEKTGSATSENSNGQWPELKLRW